MAELPDEIIRKDTELNPVSVHVALGNRSQPVVKFQVFWDLKNLY